jgi:hypothetical protein
MTSVFTHDRAPAQTTAPQFYSAVPDAAPGGGQSLLYTPYLRPWVLSKASDADANTVR